MNGRSCAVVAVSTSAAIGSIQIAEPTWFQRARTPARVARRQKPADRRMVPQSTGIEFVQHRRQSAWVERPRLLVPRRRHAAIGHVGTVLIVEGVDPPGPLEQRGRAPPSREQGMDVFCGPAGETDPCRRIEMGGDRHEDRQFRGGRRFPVHEGDQRRALEVRDRLARARSEVAPVIARPHGSDERPAVAEVVPQVHRIDDADDRRVRIVRDREVWQVACADPGAAAGRRGAWRPVGAGASRAR